MSSSRLTKATPIIAVAGCILLLVSGACRRRPAVPDSDALEAAHRDRVKTEAEGHHQDGQQLADEEVRERLAELDAAIRKRPRDAALMDRKLHFALQHDPAAAVDQCREILALDSRNTAAMTHLAGGYMGLGRVDLALHWAGQAMATEDNAETRILVAEIRLLRGEREAAAKHFRHALKHDPGNAMASNGLRRCRQ